MLLLALLSLSAQARPTEGGQFGYVSADQVTSWDSPGGIRVHYAVSGPSVTRLEDDDDNGVPDFVEGIAFHVEASLERYEQAGFRRPLRESDVGLAPLGGSDAFDVYLVDFDGVGDGAFRQDDCRDGVCAGHLLIENDFVGYGYSDLEEAYATLASHELFHAVQAAYTETLDVWVSEGTATWAQLLYDPDSRDYLRFVSRYLQDAGRSLDRPPTGPVPAFAYGTALWFDFLARRHGATAIHDLLVTIGETGAEPVPVLTDLLADRGDGWDATFLDFASWNLATFSRAGGLTEGGYPYAARLSGLQLESVADSWQDDRRVFPLGALYFAVDHPGGPMWAGSAACDDGDDLPAVRVHPSTDGVVLDPVDTVFGAGRPIADGADLPAGRYFVVLTVPRPADASSQDLVCVHAADALPEACTCAPDAEDTDLASPPEDVCGCRVSSVGGAPLLGLIGLALAWRRRRRPHR